jgi:hypothetical protein
MTIKQYDTLPQIRSFMNEQKKIEVDYNFIREKVQSGEIKTTFIRSNEQLADIFTKALDKTGHWNILDKLRLINPYKHN